MVNNFDSGRVELLESLKCFTIEATRDLVLPTRMQGKNEKQAYRAADVYLMRLPDSRSASKKAPYILHQLFTGTDQQAEGKRTVSTAKIRTIFCAFSEDEQEGALMLLNLMERLRISLLRKRTIGKRYALDMEAGLEFLVYPEDTAPYFAGEMASTWIIPAIEREVQQWL